MTDIQKAVVEWHDREWNTPRKSTVDIALKLCEEAGEVAGAVTKLRECRVGASTANIRDEIGDVLIVLEVLTARLGTTVGQCLEARWLTVRERKSSGYRP
jgi:NTP pyrophosphatase (non-canonical NTP hydrolase)